MDIPIRLLETETLAPDTHLIRILGGEGVSPVAIHLNSMVITGREPIVVDTGAGVARDLWFEAVEAVVDPADVRWIFLSHDDPDHTGNLLEMLDRAPRATLVTNWFTVERLSASYQLPMDRMRWVNEDESFHAGDRELRAVLPAHLRQPHDPRAVRHDHGRLLGQRLLRHARHPRGPRHRRARPRLLPRGVPALPAHGQPLAPLARPRPLRAAPRHGPGPPRLRGGRRPRPGLPRRPGRDGLQPDGGAPPPAGHGPTGPGRPRGHAERRSPRRHRPSPSPPERTANTTEPLCHAAVS